MSTDLRRTFEGLPPEAQQRFVKALAEMLQRMRDEILPAMEQFNEAFRRMQATLPSNHATGTVIDVRIPHVKVPPTPPLDPRQQALAARRNRNTGPSHNPYTHRGSR